jgi:hypothetical protein
VCFSRDLGDSIEEPGVLYRRQVGMQGATRNIEPRGCVFVGGIDPGVLEINDPQQRRSLSNNAGFGLLSLAQGFGGGGSTPEMAIETFDKMEAFVISRNAGIDKVMRGIGIANRFSAGMNGTRADTSTEDPSLFCTEERVIKGLAEQCRFHSDEASLMMAASPPRWKASPNTPIARSHRRCAGRDWESARDIR